MPQPVSPTSWSFAPKGTLSRPDISVAIAAVIAEWTWVERGLVSLVGNAFGSSNGLVGGISLKTNMTAFDMMATAETIRGRIALLQATVGKLLKTSPLEERWNLFLKALTGRSKERNRIAHAQWMQSADFPSDLIEYDPSTETMYRWTEKDVIQTLDRIIEVRNEAHNILLAIIDALHRGQLAEGDFGPIKAR